MYVFFLLPLEGYAGRHMIDRFATYESLFNGCHQKNYINSMSQRDESLSTLICTSFQYIQSFKWQSTLKNTVRQILAIGIWNSLWKSIVNHQSTRWAGLCWITRLICNTGHDGYWLQNSIAKVIVFWLYIIWDCCFVEGCCVREWGSRDWVLGYCRSMVGTNNSHSNTYRHEQASLLSKGLNVIWWGDGLKLFPFPTLIESNLEMDIMP